MPVVEVSCPSCRAKLKAPDSLAGKKAKCKKCGTGFRVPGPVPASETVGDGEALSAFATPALPDPVAGAAKGSEQVTTTPAPPKELKALPAADPFDLGKTAKPAVADAPKPTATTPTPAPAKSPLPTAKPRSPDDRDEDDRPAKAKRRRDEDEDDRPKKKRKREGDEDEDDRPAKAKRRRDKDEDEDDRPKKKRRDDDADTGNNRAAAPVPIPSAPADNPFAFSAESDDKPARSKRRDDEDDRPEKTRKREDDDEDRPKSKRRDEDEDDRPKKTRRNDDAAPDGADNKSPAVAAQPVAPVPVSSGGTNPFAFSALGEAPANDEDDRPKKKQKREDDENDRPAKAKRRRDEDDEDDRPKKKRKREGDEDEDGKSRYRRPAQAGTGKAMLFTGAIGGLALVLGIAAVIVYVRSNRPEPEVTKKEEKKDEPSIPAGPAEPAAKVEPKKEKEPPAKKPDAEPKVSKEPERPAAPGGRQPLALPKLKTFAIAAPPVRPVLSDQRKNDPTVLDVPLASVRRVFPPLDAKTGDTCVLIQTAAGAGGKGERLALDSFGPSGNRVPAARIEYDGDGLATPIADLHSSASGTFFLAAVGGKLHVWSLADKTKLANGLSPYADKPEHAKAGLAAAFFAPDPNQVFTVSTAGGVLLYDLRARKAVSEYNPPNGAPGKVALGQSVAKADGNGSVVVAVAGILYQIEGKTNLDVVRKYELDGDVGRSIALAAGGTPGRLLYVFETIPDKAGKKETAVLGLPLGDAANHVLYQLPPAAGEPKGALWVNGDVGGVVTDKGVAWFDDHEGKFLPLMFAQPPAGGGLYFGDEKDFWYVVPHPTMPAAKSVVVAVSGDFNDRAEFQNNYPNKPLRTVRLDSAGLSK
jgi:hypothetical protein